MKIYIVLAECGRYDDTFTEVLEVFTNEKDAQAFEDEEYDSGKFGNVWTVAKELK